MSIALIHAVAAAEVALARAIFIEYGASIASAAGCSLQHQGFDDELASLPGKYAPPRGCIVLAFDTAINPVAGAEPLYVEKPLASGGGDEPIGCIAIRPLIHLGPDVCELKRMYVKHSHRGRGVGRLLCAEVLTWAQSNGYSVMKLDTDASFAPAIALYQTAGFVACERYNDDPMDDTLWFEKRLGN